MESSSLSPLGPSIAELLAIAVAKAHEFSEDMDVEEETKQEMRDQIEKAVAL